MYIDTHTHTVPTYTLCCMLISMYMYIFTHVCYVYEQSILFEGSLFVVEGILFFPGVLDVIAVHHYLHNQVHYELEPVQLHAQQGDQQEVKEEIEGPARVDFDAHGHCGVQDLCYQPVQPK